MWVHSYLLHFSVSLQPYGWLTFRRLLVWKTSWHSIQCCCNYSTPVLVTVPQIRAPFIQVDRVTSHVVALLCFSLPGSHLDIELSPVFPWRCSHNTLRGQTLSLFTFIGFHYLLSTTTHTYQSSFSHSCQISEFSSLLRMASFVWLQRCSINAPFVIMKVIFMGKNGREARLQRDKTQHQQPVVFTVFSSNLTRNTYEHWVCWNIQFLTNAC